MERNEIRFGNYIVDNDEDSETGYIQVNAVLMELIMYHPETFEPIPLSEEWLLKFGFEKNKNNRKNYTGDVFKFTMNAYNAWFCVYYYERYDMGNVSSGFRSYIETNHHNEFNYNDNWPFICSVHQLQNLYFALTGEELKIKESTLQTERNKDHKDGFQ